MIHSPAPLIDLPWIATARSRIGQREIPGPAENSWIVGLWKKIRRGGIKTESVPWCAAFVGACLEDAGIVSTRFESAASYLTWGGVLFEPTYGCIVVFARDGGGHVGFVVGEDEAGRLLVLGGNQGYAVSIAPFPRARVSGYRWPYDIPVSRPWLPILSSAAPSSTNEA